MESVLRRLRLKKGDGRDSEARKRLQKELFAFSACSDHGFAMDPCAMAFDPKLSLLAIGTTGGAIRLFGKPGVYFSGQHKNAAAITKMCFLPDEARIVTLCVDNSLHLWELNVKEDGVSVLEQVKSCEIENSESKKVTSFCVTSANNKLIIGTDAGNIQIFDISTFQLTDTTLLKDSLIQNAPEDFKVNPGSIEVVLQHPLCPDKFLIGFERGLIVLWDLESNKSEHTYYASQQLEAMRFAAGGAEFVTSHSDGSYIVWNTDDSTKPKELSNTPYGPFPCKPITAIDRKQGTSESWMIFSGGMPRASFGDRHTVSVIHGGTHVTFDLSSRIIDFITLSDSTTEDPQTLLVLTVSELIAIDLASEGWPVVRNPYSLAVNSSSPVTCMQHVNHVTEALWTGIVAAGSRQFESFSTKEWPITGGQVDESVKLGHDLLLTGHADGSVCFWDVRLNGGARLLYTLTTSNVFSLADSAASDAAAPQEDEWPPFRKVGTSPVAAADSRLAVRKMTFCPTSETLVLGGEGGQVIVFKFESGAGERKLDSATVDVIVKRDDLSSTSCTSLTAVNDVTWTAAGFQPRCVVQMLPAVACTTLAVHADSQILAVSTSYGVGVFDFARMQTVYVNSVTVPTGIKISRSRSFQKTLRDSFRQLRRHRSYDVAAAHKTEQKEATAAENKPEGTETAAETTEEKPQTEVVIEKVEEKMDETPKIEEVKSEEGQVEMKGEMTVTETGDKVAAEPAVAKEEAKEIIIEEIAKQETEAETATEDKSAETTAAPADTKDKKKEETSSIIMTNIESLCFADTTVLHGQPVSTTLWIGTNTGHVFIWRLTLPETDKRQEEDIKCTLVKEIRLKHGAPVIGVFVVDHDLRALVRGVAVTTEPSAAEGETTVTPTTPSAAGGHRVIVVTRQQVKIFSLPNLKAQGKFKLALHGDDVQFTDSALATFVSKSDEAYSEADIVCLTSLNKLCVFSLPHLRRQLESDAIVVKSTSGSAVAVVTQSGGVFFCSGSELSEYSASARSAAPRCCVELKEGMRPVPVVAEPVVEAVVEAAAEAPGGGEENAAAAIEDTHPSVDVQATCEVSVAAAADESVMSANDSMAAGDVTADSIKVHVSTKDESSTVGDSGMVASHKVVETTVHSVKTIGDHVSECTTTTVEEMKKIEGLMSVCTVSSSSVTTSSTTNESSSIVKVEGN